MRRTTRSCRLGGTTSARMKRWPLSGSTVGCVIGLPAFGDAPAWCRKRSRWSMPPSRCLPPTTLMEQRQNSPCHCLLNTLDEEGSEVGANEAGNIAVETPNLNLMIGYWNNPEATA